jgi:hypothetical protein
MARSKSAKPATTKATADVDELTPVRTTFNPREVIRVGAAELLDLTRQGLIYEGEDLAEPANDESKDAGNGAAPESTTTPAIPAGSTEGGGK